MSSKRVKELITLSREFGTVDYAVGGGGNTSVKDADVLLVKQSGKQLLTADEETFIALDRAMIATLMEARYPEEPAEREALVKRSLLRTVLEPDKGGRPSVEATLHHLIPYRFVVHTHPWVVNAFTCAKDSRAVLTRVFSDALVVPYCDPGHVLASKLRTLLDGYVGTHGKAPRIIFLENHGLIVSADSPNEIRSTTERVVATCRGLLKKANALPVRKESLDKSGDDERIARIITAIRSSLSVDSRKTTARVRTSLADGFVRDKAAFQAVSLPFTPDQIVYGRSHPLWVPVPNNDADVQRIVSAYMKGLSAYRTRYGVDPRVVAVEGVGIVTAGDSAQESRLIASVIQDSMMIAFGSRAAGGPRHLSTAARAFIENWEVEKYRRGVATGGPASGARTAIVTGGAQGFGEGIVRSLFADGFNVVIADLNDKRGEALAGELNGIPGTTAAAICVKTDVANEKSVRTLVTRSVLEFGGCDVFISNAGVLRAGGLEEIDSETFDFMTNVNYKGYFVGAKYASAQMKNQHEINPDLMCDIIQINSKSGLEGSNRNFTYAGGKFGGIGLTQSFALELIPHGIKVNSVCPGNFLDGPLWADPKTGLFVQYLKTGKVPGAKSVSDVRKAYEDKVPARRGCTVSDVMKAVRYVIDQEYETGQAVPVTGGQVMLK